MLIVIARIGKDATLATTKAGKPLMEFTAAFNQGYGDHQTTVWLQCVKWGDKNAGICQYLTKGTQVQLQCSEILPEAYTARDGSIKAVIKATVSNIQLVGSTQGAQAAPQQQQYQQPQQRQAAPQQRQPMQQQAPQQYQQPPAGFAGDFDDDIPF